MRFIIWGAGKLGAIACELLKEYIIVGVVDGNPLLAGERLFGYRIWNKKEFLKNYQGEIVVITPNGYETEIGDWLNKHGVKAHYGFRKELWGLAGLVKQYPREKIIEEIKACDEWTIFPRNLLAILLEDRLRKNGIKCVTYTEVNELNGKNVIVTEFIEDRERSVIERISRNVLDFSNLGTKAVYYNPELEKFKDCHAGERCFIVGTGPSLKYSDLDKLANNQEYCLSVNGIFKGFSETVWRPDCYCVSDMFAAWEWRRQIVDMEGPIKFIADTAWQEEFFEGKENLYKWHFISEDKNMDKFSPDLTTGFFWGWTVVYDCCLPLAIFMGFKEIYLLGVDCTQAKSQEKQHFVREYEDKIYKGTKLRVEEIMSSLKNVKRYADMHNIKIFNATRGGDLEIFERINFDSLFK